MKLTQTGLPLRSARSIVPPPTCGTTRAGAGSPIWNRPAALAEAAGDAGRRDGRGRDADGDGAGRRSDVTGVADGSALGTTAVASGANV